MGRPRGSKNKITLKHVELAIATVQKSEKAALKGELLATDVMSRAMNLFWQASIAARDQKQIDQAFIFARDAANIGADLAKFQSPQLQSVTVARVDPYAGLSDAELFEELKKRAAAVGLVPKGPPPKLIQGKIVKGGDDAD